MKKCQKKLAKSWDMMYNKKVAGEVVLFSVQTDDF